MRALVTGANGFVGRHLVELLRARGTEVATAGRAGDGGALDFAFDLRDGAGLREALIGSRPDVVFHLAAQTFVPEATRDPLATYEINALGTALLYEALRASGTRPLPRVLVASSGEVYGARPAAEQPLHEGLAPRPTTTYAASKVASEAIALASSRTYGIPTVVSRAFNHIGPGQSERFAVASFAHGLAAIAAGGKPILEVGNLKTSRDFLDVRDVVAAYVALAERGTDGEIYNVSSGKAVALQEILRQLISIAHVPVEVREDPERLRPSDVPFVCGANAKLRTATDWQPQITLAQSLRDVYADALARLAPAP